MPLVPYGYTTGLPGTAAGPTTTTYTTAIPLDLTSGRELGQHTQTANEVFTVASGSVTNGWANLTYVGDSVHTADFSAFTIVNGWTFDNTKVAELAFIKRFGTRVLLAGTNIGGGDVTAPAPVGAPFVLNASPTVIRQEFSEPLVTNGIVAADGTATGKTINAVAIVGTQLQFTVSSAFTNGQTSNLSVAASKLKDAAGNLTAAITTQAITNNVLPAAPVFTSQSAPGGTNGTPYTYTFVATGAVNYAVFSGTVPAGTTLNTATGVLSGTPTTTAGYTFVISATNTGGTTNSTSQSVTIAAAGTGALSAATFTDGAETMSALDDYFQLRSVSTADRRKGTGASTPAGFLTRPVATNLTRTASPPAAANSRTYTNSLIADDSSGYPISETTTFSGGWQSITSVLGDFTFTAPAGIGTKKVRIAFYLYQEDASGIARWKLTSSLSDASATALNVSLVQTSGYTGQYFTYEITYNAASAAQTLTVSITQTTAQVNHVLGVQSISYGN